MSDETHNGCVIPELGEEVGAVCLLSSWDDKQTGRRELGGLAGLHAELKLKIRQRGICSSSTLGGNVRLLHFNSTLYLLGHIIKVKQKDNCAS